MIFVKYIVPVLFFCLVISCHKKNTKSKEANWPVAQATPVNVGDMYQGGIVAYIFQPSDQNYDPNLQHGIIVSPTDIGTAAWGSYTLTLVNDTLIGSGRWNTGKLMDFSGASNFAARVCFNYNLSGYTDWYLPSKNELEKLYVSKAIVGGFMNNYYWSSSEINTSAAWQKDFGTGYNYYGSKTNAASVRAIRYF